MTSSFRMSLILAMCMTFFLSCLQVTAFGQDPADETGIASWYGRRHHGKITASGERYNMHAMTAAHKKLPFGTIVKVKQLSTGNAVVVRITDRGPFVKKRIIDLSYAASCGLGMNGIAKVSLEIVGKKDGFPLSADDAFYVRLSRRPQDGDAVPAKRTVLTGTGSESPILQLKDGTPVLGPFGNFKDAHNAYMGIAKAFPAASIILEKKDSAVRLAMR